MGFSVNTLTLFGVALATGLVVDDAIVVIENIERHIQEGERHAQTASVAMSEVAEPSSPLRCGRGLCVVFPALFRQFALTIAFSISISAFNALTLTPRCPPTAFGRASREELVLGGDDKAINGVTKS